MYLLSSLRKSTPLQNRQLDILSSNRKQQVDDFVGESTFKMDQMAQARDRHARAPLAHKVYLTECIH